MSRLQPWLIRDDPAYDPNRIGAISEAKVITALVQAGKVIYTPVVNVLPYDLIMEENDGRFYRVQCKTGRLIRGTICFAPHRLRAARRETGWVRRVTTYEGEVDFFGVYCPENDCTYLVPIEDVKTHRCCSLRLTPPKNNQSKKIRWARDYLVVPMDLTQYLQTEDFFD
jgi:hypothetical protein